MQNHYIQIYFPEDREGADFIFSYLGVAYKKINNLNLLRQSGLFICEKGRFNPKNNHIRKFIDCGGKILLVPKSITGVNSPNDLLKGILSGRDNVYILKYNIFRVCRILMRDENGKFNSGKFKRRFPIDSLLYDTAKAFFGTLLKIQGTLFFKWFWPQDTESAVILSHDIDTKYCFNEGLERLRALEKKRRYHSIWLVRPGDRYELDSKKLRRLAEDGCEIGLHTIDEAFKNKKILSAQKRFLEEKINKKVFGVRNHCLVREVLKTQAIEKESGFLYESNIPDTDNCVPHFENRGCTFFYPYTLKDMLIFPLTLHDWCFIAGNKYADNKTMSYYLKKLNYIHSRNGLMTALFHGADYMTGGKRLWMYEKFLMHIAKTKNMRVALPRDVYQWIKKRNSINFKVADDKGNIKIIFTNSICTLAVDSLSYNLIKDRKICFFYNSRPLNFKIKKAGNYVLFCFVNPKK